MMLITAAILCAGITIGHLFLKRITGPLSFLAQAAEDISGGPIGSTPSGVISGVVCGDGNERK
jgi:hypothetical protein